MVNPAIILISPQMGENIGAAARVMKNFGLSDLRIVSPRDGWPNPKAVDMAKNAKDIIEAAQIFDSTKEALHDVTTLFATTARPRDLAKSVLTPHHAAQQHANLKGCAILFGPERTGLSNDDIVLADHIISIPVSAAYSSLNLAQSVAIIAYEWFQLLETPPSQDIKGLGEPASKQELIGFFEHLEGLLEDKGFYKTPEIKPKMVQNMRNMFGRMEASAQEVRTLRGVLKTLE